MEVSRIRAYLWRASGLTEEKIAHCLLQPECLYLTTVGWLVGAAIVVLNQSGQQLNSDGSDVFRFSLVSIVRKKSSALASMIIVVSSWIDRVLGDVLSKLISRLK